MRPMVGVWCVSLRVLRDVEAVRQEALLLREQMLVVKEDIKRVCHILNLTNQGCFLLLCLL